MFDVKLGYGQQHVCASNHSLRIFTTKIYNLPSSLSITSLSFPTLLHHTYDLSHFSTSTAFSETVQELYGMAANSQAPRGNPLEQLIGDHLIKHLSTTIVEHGKKPVYSCGGHIPIGSFKSVIVRWDTVEEDAVSKPFLVVSKLHLPSTEDDLQRLINACQPATFGHHHEEIMDLDYRTAGKMDAEDFSTNFHLSAFGILDTIKQILRPGAASSKKLHSNGIRAELCKLNVCSALLTAILVY